MVAAARVRLLRARTSVALVMFALAGAVACAQPETATSAKQAAELDVATSRISVACGYEEELTAYRRPSPPRLASVESIAVSGARKLAFVYGRDRSGIYQGESVGAIVNDSISLLAACRLPAARNVLERAVRRQG